jgi:hypothetical protein
MPFEYWSSAMSRCTSANTIVTSSATIHVDHHGLTTINQALFDKKLQKPSFYFTAKLVERSIQDWLSEFIPRRFERSGDVGRADKRQDMFRYGLFRNS